MKQRHREADALLDRLLERGVVIHAPRSLEIDPDVNPERIACGVVIHAGCRLRGAKTSIGPGSCLGADGPVTVDNCRLGHGVKLAGGSFAGSVFLDDVTVGSCASVRPGTLIEEGVTAGHAVGFKQTILMPFVAVGSLVNFCDVLMAGGDGSDRHGEIGSAFIHFNYTPRGDKATASLIGDVPRGVMLDQAPVFLGGQAGLVGPARLAFGSVLPAGVICRGDMTEPDRIYIPTPRESWGTKPYDLRVYGRIGRKIVNNLHFIGNLLALRAWYGTARKASMHADAWRQACCEGGEEVLSFALAERLKQLDRLCERLEGSVALLAARKNPNAQGKRLLEQQRAFIDRWPAMREQIGLEPDPAGMEHRERFLAGWERVVGQENGHRAAIQALDDETRQAGTAWLAAIAGIPVARWSRHGVDR